MSDESNDGAWSAMRMLGVCAEEKRDLKARVADLEARVAELERHITRACEHHGVCADTESGYCTDPNCGYCGMVRFLTGDEHKEAIP